MVDYFSLALAHGLLLLALWRLVLRPDLDDETPRPKDEVSGGKQSPNARRRARQASSSTSQ